MKFFTLIPALLVAFLHQTAHPVMSQVVAYAALAGLGLFMISWRISRLTLRIAALETLPEKLGINVAAIALTLASVLMLDIGLMLACAFLLALLPLPAPTARQEGHQPALHYPQVTSI